MLENSSLINKQRKPGQEDMISLPYLLHLGENMNINIWSGQRQKNILI